VGRLGRWPGVGEGRIAAAADSWKKRIPHFWDATMKSWKDKVPNEEVLRRANTSRQLMLTIVTRQIHFVGHVVKKG